MKENIIAVDFDGTLCTNKFPEVGDPNINLIAYLIKRRLKGDSVILWSCRSGEKLDEAVAWCKSHGLEFDAVNENLPEIIEAFGGKDTRKIYADVYLDDRAIRPKIIKEPGEKRITYGLLDDIDPYSIVFD